MTLSVVIPTWDRHTSLVRLLRSIAAQDRRADEVVIVTGAADRCELVTLASNCGLACPVTVLETEASVCIQRNAGIRAAFGTHVCLADDDIELPCDYFSKILDYMERITAGVVSGLVVQRDPGGEWRAEYPPTTLRQLGWRLLFQQGVWGELNAIETSDLGRIALRWVAAFYRRRGNTYTWAGWPLITNFSGPVIRTTVYGLGAAVVRRDWLLHAPYDEVLDRHGIGDNYGVAVGFPERRPIHVLTGVRALHHREAKRRLDDRVAHYRRSFALDYFLKRSGRFTALNRLALRWSIVGFALAKCRERDWPAARSNLRLLARLCLTPNPYAVGAARGFKKLTLY